MSKTIIINTIQLNTILENLEKNIEDYSNEEMSSIIKSVLESVFSKNWMKSDDYFSPGIRGIYTIGSKTNNEDETWSILNYFDTKPEIHKMILDKYHNENPDNLSLISWMKNMFTNDKKFIEILVDRQWDSIKNGINTENKLNNLIREKLPNSEIKTFLHGAKMDRYEGVDMVVNGKNIQIKPLNGVKKYNKFILINTYKMSDMYKRKKLLDYIAYVSEDGTILLFPNNRYYMVDSNTVKHYTDPYDLSVLS